MTAALEGGEWSAARTGRTLLPEKTRYPFYRRLGRPQGRSGRAEKLILTGIRSRNVQLVVSRYTDWATRPTIYEYNHGKTTSYRMWPLIFFVNVVTEIFFVHDSGHGIFFLQQCEHRQFFFLQMWPRCIFFTNVASTLSPTNMTSDCFSFMNMTTDSLKNVATGYFSFTSVSTDNFLFTNMLQIFSLRIWPRI